MSDIKGAAVLFPFSLLKIKGKRLVNGSCSVLRLGFLPVSCHKGQQDGYRFPSVLIFHERIGLIYEEDLFFDCRLENLLRNRFHPPACERSLQIRC